MTTQQDMNRNPTGKGGFRDHPENQSPGGWKPDMSFSYQYKRFMNMDVEEFKNWKVKTADKDKKMVEELAYVAVLKARGEFKYLTEVANRADGMPKQSTDITSGGDKLSKVEFILADESSTT